MCCLCPNKKGPQNSLHSKCKTCILLNQSRKRKLHGEGVWILQMTAGTGAATNWSPWLGVVWTAGKVASLKGSLPRPLHYSHPRHPRSPGAHLETKGSSSPGPSSPSVTCMVLGRLHMPRGLAPVECFTSGSPTPACSGYLTPGHSTVQRDCCRVRAPEPRFPFQASDFESQSTSQGTVALNTVVSDLKKFAMIFFIQSCFLHTKHNTLYMCECVYLPKIFLNQRISVQKIFSVKGHLGHLGQSTESRLFGR